MYISAKVRDSTTPLWLKTMRIRVKSSKQNLRIIVYTTRDLQHYSGKINVQINKKRSFYTKTRIHNIINVPPQCRTPQNNPYTPWGSQPHPQLRNHLIISVHITIHHNSIQVTIHYIGTQSTLFNNIIVSSRFVWEIIMTLRGIFWKIKAFELCYR